MFWINISLELYLQYLQQIKISNGLDFVKDLDLEDNATLALPLFVVKEGQKEKCSVKLNPLVLKIICEKTQLLYFYNSINSNICFMSNNAELRDDYKTGFTIYDLLIYSYCRHNLKYVSYPKNADEFWYYINKGNASFL